MPAPFELAASASGVPLFSVLGKGLAVLPLQLIRGVEGHQRDLRYCSGLTVVVVDLNIAICLGRDTGKTAGRNSILGQAEQIVRGACELGDARGRPIASLN